MSDKLSKMRDAAGPLTPAHNNNGLFEDTSEKTKAGEFLAKPARVQRQKFTVSLSSDLIERARAAAYFTPGATLSSIVEKALEAEVSSLEKKRGEPFERLPEGSLPVGRPIGT